MKLEFMTSVDSTVLKVICLLAISLVASFSISQQALAQPPTSLDSSPQSWTCVSTSNNLDRLELIPYLQHYADPSLELAAPWESMATYFESLPERKTGNSFGTAQVAHWLRFCLQNTTNEVHQVVATFWPPLMLEFDFYPQQNDEQSYHTGILKPFDTRAIDHNRFSFPIQINPGETREYYFRITAANNASISGLLRDRDSFNTDNKNYFTAYGVFAGIFLGLVLFNAMLYFSVRQVSSLFFITFATVLFFLLAFFDGQMLQYVFPDSPHLSYRLMLVCYFLVGFTGSLFSRSFLKLYNFPLIDKIGIGLLIVGTLSFLTTINNLPRFLTACATYTMVMMIFYILAAVYATVKGHLEGRYYLLACLPLGATIIDRGLNNIGLTPDILFTFKPEFSLSCLMILLAYGVGRMNVADKQKAQEEALRQLKISDDLRRKYNEELEIEIANRTDEIKEKNSELEQQANQLLELDELKSRFFANISHEFRTPLTLIQGPLNQLLEQEGFEQKSLVDGVVRHSRQLQQLIDQLLTLSAFDSGSVKLTASKQDLVKVVRSLSSQFASLAEREGIELHFHSDIEQLAVYIDFDKIQIVINNLINNAIKFTESGGKITVDLNYANQEGPIDGQGKNSDDEEYTTDRYAQIKITDTGCGIVKDHLPHIFDRYFQSRTSQSQTGSGQEKPKGYDKPGSGIGLALVKELVELHIGHIEVSSIEKAGSCFTILLPLGKSHLTPSEIVDDQPEIELAGEPMPALPDPDREPNDSSAEKPVLLIVDDNHDMRDYLRSILHPDYEVVEAKDGFEAEEKIVKDPPSLIITDLMMPKRSGLELLESVKSRQEYAAIPIIMLTAKAGQEDRLKGLLAAADDYLAKPFDARELKARIANLLIKYQQLQAFYKTNAVHTKKADQEETENMPANDYLSRLRKIVEENITDPNFGVEHLAKATFVSTPTLRRKLADSSQFTPSGFIRHCRLERAKQLVAEGNMRTLAELAQAVGFSQASYFSRLYKKTFNHWPFEDKPVDEKSFDETARSNSVKGATAY